MKRKNTPGCYCCTEQTCYTLQESDLPDVSLSGWTGGDWEGNACCKCITFTPDNPVTVTACSGDYATAEITGSCGWDVRVIENAKPLLGGCPIPDDQCCGGPISSIGSGTLTDSLQHTFRAYIRYTQATVSVCISKQDVDCNGTVAEKYVVLSRYCYDVDVLSVRAVDGQRTIATTLTDDTCFKKHQGGITNYPFCDSLSEVSLDSPCDTDVFGDQDALLFSGQACFERVKFFDEPPDGEQIFDNDDDGDGCAWSFCESDFEYTTEFCYEISSFVGKPCWCDYGWNITTQTTTTNLQSRCGCDRCLTQELGTFYTTIISCDPPESSISCCPGRTCNETCYSFETTCCNIEWTAEAEDNCDLFAYTFGCGSQCPGTSCLLPRSFDELNDPSACFNDGGCGVSFMAPKYSVATNSGTSAEWTVDCQFIAPVEFCISAPTWTLVFS